MDANLEKLWQRITERQAIPDGYVPRTEASGTVVQLVRSSMGCWDDEEFAGLVIDGTLPQHSPDRSEKLIQHVVGIPGCPLCWREYKEFVRLFPDECQAGRKLELEHVHKHAKIGRFLMPDLQSLYQQMSVNAMLSFGSLRYAPCAAGGVRAATFDTPDVEAKQIENEEFACELFDTLGRETSLIISLRNKTNANKAFIALRLETEQGSQRVAREVMLTEGTGLVRLEGVKMASVVEVEIKSAEIADDESVATRERRPILPPIREATPITELLNEVRKYRAEVYPASTWYRYGEALLRQLAGGDWEESQPSFKPVEELRGTASLRFCQEELRQWVLTFGGDDRWGSLSEAIQTIITS